MREIVCIGSFREIKNFISQCRRQVNLFAKKIKLSIEWKEAADHFFDPCNNPKSVFQHLEPVKQEILFEGPLAIGSMNNHLNFFGEPFNISRGKRPAFSACMAFGIERWLSAFIHQYGSDKSLWPALSGKKRPGMT